MICEICEKDKDDVCIQLDPFEDEVNGVEVYQMMCNSCEEELRQEI